MSYHWPKGSIPAIAFGLWFILALLLSVFASIGWVMLGAWYAGTFSNQFSLQDPGGMVFWLGIPYLLLYFLPTAGAALLVILIWRSRRKKAS